MTDTTKTLLDRLDCQEVMNRYAASIDLRDWARLATVFVDGPIEAVRQTITGFDATQHFFANHSVELRGDQATDLRYMQARHQMDAAHYTIGGYYTSEMVRTAAGWRIARYRLTVTFSDGERRLMGLAYRRATGRL